MPPIPIQSPASYVPSRAAAFADLDGTSLLVSRRQSLAGDAYRGRNRAAERNRAHFGPSGTVQSGSPTSCGADTVRHMDRHRKVLRSVDAGITKLPLTISGTAWAEFTGPCCEPIWEESEVGSSLYLDVALTSGSLVYRLAQ